VWASGAFLREPESATLAARVINHAFRKTAIPKMQNVDDRFGSTEYEQIKNEDDGYAIAASFPDPEGLP
jgi:hypothetical protein